MDTDGDESGSHTAPDRDRYDCYRRRGPEPRLRSRSFRREEDEERSVGMPMAQRTVLFDLNSTELSDETDRSLTE